jgi:hypothetical protein
MNINLDISEANFTQSDNFQNDLDGQKLTNNKVHDLISLQNKQTNSKLLIPASNFSIYSRDITNRLTLSSINNNLPTCLRTDEDNNKSFQTLSNHNGKSIKRSQSIHATPSTNSHYNQPLLSYRNSFIGPNRLEIIKDDMDSSIGNIPSNENATASSSSSSNSANDSSTSSASVSSSSPSSISVIYSNMGRGFTLKKKNYDNKNINLINQTISNRSQRNERLITDLLKNHTSLTRPVPPNRTSSLNYRYNNSHLYSNSNNENIYDRNSIYSTCSFRDTSHLSTLNFENNRQNDYAPILDKNEIFKIESCYKSIGSSVHSCRCSAELYSTNLQNLINLIDWKHQLSGVPVWIFNSGNNPKRPKSINI